MARLNNEVERSHDSPMDYSWNDGRGPVDATSPFVQPVNQGWTAGQKRPSSDMESPSREELPKLRNPQGQRFLFNTMPAVKSNWDAHSRNAAFTTPRKVNLEADDTSGPEQSSPAYADSEATPDQPRNPSPSKNDKHLVKFEASQDDKKATKPSLFNRSGKGSIFKSHKYNQSIERRVDKRRRRVTDKDVQHAPRRHSNDSDDEERPSSSDGVDPKERRAHNQKPPRMGIIPSILTFIDAHPSLPGTLSYYVQFMINCIFAGVVVYILWGVISTIRHDINERAMMESSEILAEMAVCARDFKENRCERETRVPAMQSVCDGWEQCMARDPLKVGRSRLSAGMFAEIFNSFIEPISLKALVVSFAVIVGCFAVNNLTFGLYRSRHQHPPQPVPSQPAYMGHQPHMPQLGYATPGYGHYQTPYQHQLGGMPQYEAVEWKQEGSPTKRIGYR